MKPARVAIGLAWILFAMVPPRTAGQSWTLTSAPLTNWSAITCSADGMKVAATVGGWKNGSPSGQIYISTNSGVDWRATTAPLTNWNVLASSADGSKLYAGLYQYFLPDPIYSSSDSGQTWATTGSPTTNFWISICCSADGGTILASYPAYGHVPGGVLIGTNMGSGWPQPLQDWNEWPSVACSANGQIMVAPSGFPFAGSPGIYRSWDGGLTWTVTNSLYGPLVVAMRADGTKLFAASPNGGIYSSLDSGDTWQATAAPSVNWGSLACSAEGGMIIAAAGAHDSSYSVSPGPVYFSTNSGATWTHADVPNANWASVACSADGCRLFAADSSGGIYVWQTTPVPTLSIGTNGPSVLLSWLVPSANFVLQQNPDLSGSNWTDVSVNPVLSYTNLHYESTVPRSGGTMFYRLAGR